MGFNVATFHNILHHGFEKIWNETPIPCQDVLASSVPRVICRSLDACGALGLILHYLNSSDVTARLRLGFGELGPDIS